MEQSVAIGLIEKGVPKLVNNVWADLGAGTGTFTKALAALLGMGSTVYAMDRDARSIERSDPSHVEIISRQIDFVKEEIPFQPFDGILMANALHFVKDKEKLLQKLKAALKPAGRLLLIEYDTLTSNPWVPYPINYRSLETLISKSDFSSIEKLREEPSIYNRANIYSALMV